jgi:hypothetical protein
MLHRKSVVRLFAALWVCGWWVGSATAEPVTGTVGLFSPRGQYMQLTMTIYDTTTRFSLTGPDYSWFAFGFDTTTMIGYTFIVEGTDASRSVVEQNLLGIGDPGLPQDEQNITLVDVLHDMDNDLTTVIVDRPNSTGDPLDPDFSTSMTALSVIWGYDSFSSPTLPNGTLSFHGRDGRGEALIEFSPHPEPGGAVLAALAAAGFSFVRRRRA